MSSQQTGNQRSKSREAGLDDFVARDLLEAALKAAENSYSPYSHFPVGAAVLTSQGRIFSATNVENASLGLSICAERAAIFSAVSAGEAHIRALAVYVPTSQPVPPCGACLAVLSEFRDPEFNHGDIPILLSGRIKQRRTSLDRLLPEKFKLNQKER